MKGGLRTKLTISFTIAGLVAIGILTLGFNVLLRSNLRSDANRVLQARAGAALDSVVVRNGRVVGREAPDEAAPDSGVWIYQGNRAIERPEAPAEVDRLADRLARTGDAYAESVPEDLKLQGVPISQGNGRVGTAVVALSVEPYERSASRALIASLAFAAVMLALIVIATRVITNRALRPVADITREAADWSEHDLDHRFDLGPPHDELTQLAATFDDMLARLAANLRHEQRLTAEISHELRTPLAAISAEAELALSRPRTSEAYREAIETIQRRAAQLGEVMDTLLLAARANAGAKAVADANQIAESAVEATGDGDAVEFEVVPDSTRPKVSAGENVGRQILAPLLENARRYGAEKVELRVSGEGEAVVFSVADDGRGITGDEAERIFEPGARGAAAAATVDGGAGLGLPLARRLARTIGGDVFVVPSDTGARVEASLPRARRS